MVWDEFAMDENPEGFNEACEKALKEHGTQVQAHRVFRFHVDGDLIRKKLIGMVPLKATLLED